MANQCSATFSFVKYELQFHVLFLKTVYFHLWFLCKIDLRTCKYKFNGIKLFFSVRKTTLSSTFMIRLCFQGYRCKSDIVIFAWMVTWNHTYSPFKLLWKKCTFFFRIFQWWAPSIFYLYLSLVYPGARTLCSTLRLRYVFLISLPDV